MPIAEPATPAPTYGTPSVSRKPCRAPSSPVVPWMIGNHDVHAPRPDLGRHEGLRLVAVASEPVGHQARGEQLRRLAGGEESAVHVHGEGNDFVTGRIERSRDRPRRDARDLPFDRSPAEEHGDARPAHPLTM